LQVVDSSFQKIYLRQTLRLSRLSLVLATTIENGFVYLPEKAPWLPQYLHELVTFPNGKHDDQADSTSQALDWIKSHLFEPGIVGYYREEAEKAARTPPVFDRNWYYRRFGLR